MFFLTEEFVERHGMAMALGCCLIAVFAWWAWPDLARRLIEDIQDRRRVK